MRELAVASEANEEAAEKARAKAGSRLHEKEATLPFIAISRFFFTSTSAPRAK